MTAAPARSRRCHSRVPPLLWHKPSRCGRFFADPVPGVDLSKGELVLGRTTLTSALRIFSVELVEDSVRVSLGHEPNPAVLPGSEVFVGGLGIRPRHRLFLGADRYTLFFDENERLVAALAAPARARPLRREELAARYPLHLRHQAGPAQVAKIGTPG